MSAHKDRLIAAADLLGMHPDDLLAKLDPPARRMPVVPADDFLAMARPLVESIATASRVDVTEARALASVFRELDAVLSAGGTPPEAWREGPDAPHVDDAR